MKYKLDSIMFELTRFCNMECPHCIRGDRQRRRISKETILEVLNQVDFISTLEFTGGEPALAFDLMKFTLDECRAREIEVGNLWMATNGSITSKKFFDLLQVWYNYTSDGEMNGLRISIDKYHDDINVHPFKELEETFKYEGVQCFFEYSGAGDKDRDLIGEGRAYYNYSCGRSVEHAISLYIDGDNRRIEGVTYISAKGDLISTCDISFDTMDDRDERFNLGNVHNNSLDEMYDRFFEKNPDRVHEE